MNTDAKNELRSFLQRALESHGDRRPLADGDSLFVSSRLDSLTMMTLIVYLEDSFGINFAEVDFDVDRIDTVNDIEAFVDAAR